MPRALRSSQLTFSRPDDGLLGTGWANREQRSFQRLGHRLRLRVAAGNEQASLAPSRLPLRSDRRSLGSVCHQRTSRSTSRVWRIAVLSAGIRSLLWTAKGKDLCRLRHGAPPTAPALDRAAIDANDRSEPSIRGVQESAAALASRGFRLLKLPSGSVPPISNRYNATTAVPQGLPPPFQSATWSLCSSCQTARKCLCHRHCSVVAV